MKFLKTILTLQLGVSQYYGIDDSHNIINREY